MGKVRVFKNEEKERLKIIDMMQYDAKRLGENRASIKRNVYNILVGKIKKKECDNGTWI